MVDCSRLSRSDEPRGEPSLIGLSRGENASRREPRSKLHNTKWSWTLTAIGRWKVLCWKSYWQNEVSSDSQLQRTHFPPIIDAKIGLKKTGKNWRALFFLFLPMTTILCNFAPQSRDKRSLVAVQSFFCAIRSLAHALKHSRLGIAQASLALLSARRSLKYWNNQPQ